MYAYTFTEMKHQLNLPFFHDECYLRSYFEKAAGNTISLTLTENSTSMISVKRRGGTVLLRLHRMFLSADTDVLDEITGLIKTRKEKTPNIRKFIRHNIKYVERKPKRLKIRTDGRFYNLLEIYDFLNNDYFNGMVSAAITWGAKSPRRAARRRTLGSYSKSGKIIRINPVLDSIKVPGYYIEYVVYHEMLHADMDAEKGRAHSGEFRKRERLFKHYEKALAWEKKR